MPNYLELLNPNRNWSIGTHGQLNFVNISGDLSAINISVNDISINDLLKATSALIDNAIFNNITINNIIKTFNLEISNNLYVNNDASFNSNIQINGNILDVNGNKGLDGQFLRSTPSGWEWQYLDASYVSDVCFNELVSIVNAIDASYVSDVSFNELVSIVNAIDASYVSDVSFNEFVSIVNAIDASYVSDVSFNELVSIVNAIDASYVSDVCFNEAITRIDLSLNKLNLIDISLQNYDISLTQLIQTVRDICGAEFLDKIRNISGDVINIQNILSNVSGDLFNLVDVVNNLDISYLTDISFFEFVNVVNNLDSSYVTDLCFNEYKIIVENSFNSLKFDISNIENKLDNSFNYIIQDISIINQNIENLETKVDSCFNYIIQDISNINQNIENLETKVDSCFNFVIEDISIINQNIENLETKVDSCFNYIVQDISIINQNIENLETKVDSCFNYVVQDISIINQNIENLETKVDTCFNLFTQDLSNINTILNNLDLSFASDASFSELENKINNLDPANFNEIINDVSQTFYTISTQQPYKFDSSGLLTEKNSAYLLVSWNYDNIMARNIDNSFSNLADSNNNKQKLLPFIDNIQIDICGTINGVSTGWQDFSNINIPNNISYNQYNYKNLQINKYADLVDPYSSNFIIETILASLDPFDLRIYGNNFSINYPSIENRALIFRGISFEPATPPSRPNFISENIINKYEIELVFDVSRVERALENSISRLKSYIIDFSENNTTRSSKYILNINDLSDSNDFLQNIRNGDDFTINLNNLKPGTKYNYSIIVNNTINSLIYSEKSINNISNFTFLPNSRSIGTIIQTNINQNIVNISTPLFNNNNIIYINLSDPTDIIDYTYNDNSNKVQSIEISRPYFDGQENTNFGYGKFIDNSMALVTLNVSVNNIIKQTITFDGSFNSNNGNNSSSFNYIILPNDSLRDIYYDIEKDKGFRLEGRFELTTINNNDMVNAFGDASSNPYTLNYSYLRHNSINGSNSSDNYNIYIDDLSGDPVINLLSTTNEINSVIYNMGIPSVQEFKIMFSRNYENINSQYNYLRGDNIIARINNISNTSGSSFKNIVIANNDIISDGSYSFNITQMQNKTGSYYNNLNYNTSIFNTMYSLNWSETAFNLLKNNSVNVNMITNHYCDYNSYNKFNEKITFSKLDLSNINLYEIDSNSISLLGSDIAGINLIQYTNHENLIQEYTLMYINGQFQSNSSQNYPIVGDYSYNNISISNFYNSGNVSYDLNGNNSGLTNNGYKYIVFKINKNPNDATSNGSYIFNNSIYNVIISGDGYKYLNISSLLSEFFDSTIISNIFDRSNNDAIAFCKVSLQNGNYNRIGNLKQTFNPIGGNWIENGGVSVGYNSSLSKPYGCKVENSNGDLGIYISYTSLNDDLKLFIGLKN